MEKVTISKIEYQFLLSQNAQLIKQNRELQIYVRGKSRRISHITDSLGASILDKYCPSSPRPYVGEG